MVDVFPHDTCYQTIKFRTAMYKSTHSAIYNIYMWSTEYNTIQYACTVLTFSVARVSPPPSATSCTSQKKSSKRVFKTWYCQPNTSLRRHKWAPHLGLENGMFSESWSHPPDSVVVLADDDPIANGTRWFSTMLPCFMLKITSRRGVRWLCDLPSATFICLLNAGVPISSPAATVPGEGKASLGTFIGLCACSAVPAICVSDAPTPTERP